MKGSPLYRDSLALLTDLYQLTMAQGYWKEGLAERSAVFHLTFRKCPFEGQFAVACGLRAAVEFLDNFGFRDDDLDYLAGLQGRGGAPLFASEFLDYLGRLRLQCDVDAMLEGTLAFPHQPLVRVQGPLLQAQLLETPLLTMINFPTLVATKAARICSQAAGQSVLEFGLRRAQGPDGGVSASRAAFIGGCDATSNVLAGKRFGIPVKGTHAHSWVMAFEDELAAFQAYADAMPHNCVFLVDTYDTLTGVRNAIRAARTLREQGHEMIGIRLDSGDLAQLSREARRMLDEAGFPDAAIVASSDLDEYEIRKLNQAGARIDIWGVGTRLATAYDCPALGGIYKLAALRDEQGHWQYRVKLSEQAIKTSDPGILQVRRYLRQGKIWGDVVFDEPTGISADSELVRVDGSSREPLPSDGSFEDLLRPVFRHGQRVWEGESAQDAQRRCRGQLEAIDDAVTRLTDPVAHRTGLESRLYALKRELMQAAEPARGDEP